MKTMRANTLLRSTALLLGCIASRSFSEALPNNESNGSQGHSAQTHGHAKSLRLGTPKETGPSGAKGTGPKRREMAGNDNNETDESEEGGIIYASGPHTTEGIKVRLHGVEPFGLYDMWIFENEYKSYVESYYRSEGAEAIKVSIFVQNVDPPLLERKLQLRRNDPGSRGLSESLVTVTFDQESKYSLPPDFTLGDFIHSPFRHESDRINFMERLGRHDAFMNITHVGHLEVPVNSLSTATTPKAQSTEGNAPDGKVLTIIIAVLATVVVELLLIGLGCSIYQKRKRARGYGDEKGNGSNPSTPTTFGGDASLVSGQWQNSVVEVDGVSIIEGRVQQNDGASVNFSDYASDNQTDLTAEYDYKKAFGSRQGDSVGGWTGGGNSMGNSIGGEQSVFSEVASFVFGEDGSYLPGAEGNKEAKDKKEKDARFGSAKEQHLNVFAPPGKLGIALDKQDGWAPIVHSIHDNSIVRDKLQVGDRLVALNDQDVTRMSALAASKLVAQTNDLSRKLSVIRSIP